MLEIGYDAAKLQRLFSWMLSALAQRLRTMNW